MNNGENREWYSFIKGENTKTGIYPSSIRIGEKNVVGEEDIKKEIEIFWRNISGKNPKNFIHTIDENSKVKGNN